MYGSLEILKRLLQNLYEILKRCLFVAYWLSQWVMNNKHPFLEDFLTTELSERLSLFFPYSHLFILLPITKKHFFKIVLDILERRLQNYKKIQNNIFLCTTCIVKYWFKYSVTQYYITNRKRVNHITIRQFIFYKHVFLNFLGTVFLRHHMLIVYVAASSI